MGTIIKAIYYPRQDTQVAPFYKNAYTQLDTGGLATKYNILPATMTIIQGHNTNIPLAISKANTDKQVSKESNKLKNEELERAKKAIMPIFEAIQAAPNFDEADAELLGISPATLRNWEQGRRRPEGAARVLLCVAAKYPRSVLDTVRA